jgi:hypothetical protein
MNGRDQILKIVELKEAFKVTKTYDPAVSYPMLEALLTHCFLLTETYGKEDSYYKFIEVIAQDINYEMEKIAAATLR